MITWESKKEQIFEMPTGGAAIMRQGPNLLKLSRKEQCLALLTQLRTKFKIDGYIYRVFPNGEVQYLHPKVGAVCCTVACCCWHWAGSTRDAPHGRAPAMAAAQFTSLAVAALAAAVLWQMLCQGWECWQAKI